MNHITLVLTVVHSNQLSIKELFNLIYWSGDNRDMKTINKIPEMFFWSSTLLPNYTHKYSHMLQINETHSQVKLPTMIM